MNDCILQPSTPSCKDYMCITKMNLVYLFMFYRGSELLYIELFALIILSHSVIYLC